MEVNGQLHAPAALSPGTLSTVPIGWEVEWGPEPVWAWWWREKIIPSLPGNESESFSP